VKSTFITLLVLCFRLDGCYTYDPYTGEKKISIDQGAASARRWIAWAAYRWRRAAHRKNRDCRWVGAWRARNRQLMDRQQDRAAARPRWNGVSVTRMGDNITLNARQYHLQEQQFRVGPSFYKVLKLGQLVVKNTIKTVVEVWPHGQHRRRRVQPTASERRASSVAQYLESQDWR